MARTRKATAPKGRGGAKKTAPKGRGGAKKASTTSKSAA